MWATGQREIVIDLRGVSSRDAFQRELARHFPIAADHSALWSSFYAALLSELTNPQPRFHLWHDLNSRLPRLRFVGWEEFERRMPRYARRITRFLKHFYRPVPG